MEAERSNLIKFCSLVLKLDLGLALPDFSALLLALAGSALHTPSLPIGGLVLGDGSKLCTLMIVGLAAAAAMVVVVVVGAV